MHPPIYRICGPKYPKRCIMDICPKADMDGRRTEYVFLRRNLAWPPTYTVTPPFQNQTAVLWPVERTVS